MDVKLTLKLNKTVIEKAKQYASAHNRSLSRIIESYLQSLVSQENESQKGDFDISPFVKSMRTGVKVPADLDYKKLYQDRLNEKYK